MAPILLTAQERHRNCAAAMKLEDEVKQTRIQRYRNPSVKKNIETTRVGFRIDGNCEKQKNHRPRRKNHIHDNRLADERAVRLQSNNPGHEAETDSGY